MKMIWMSLIVMGLAALAACQPVESPAQAPQATQAEIDPQSRPTQDAAPSVPQEDTEMVPVTPPDEAAENMVKLVKEHLAQRLSIAADQIVLSDVKPVVWRDAGLGCPKPGVDYIQMETPGYTIFLEAGGRTYNYHTDEARRFVLCNR